MATAPAALLARGLLRRFASGPGASGVGPIDLALEAGSTFALLGPSGSGKSTTLRLLAGLERPDAGSIEIAGRDATAADPLARGVAIVFDDAPLYGHLPVAANLELGLDAFGLRGADADRSRRAAIEAFGLGHLLARRAETLSAGERRRVALARAVARRPRLLLLDEPLGNLDGPARLALRETLRSALAELGPATATALVTHDHELATGLAPRIGFLHEGRLVQIGSPEDLWRHPAHLAVATGFGPEPCVALPDGAGGFLAFRPSHATPSGASGESSARDGLDLPVRDAAREFGGDRARWRVTLDDDAATVLLAAGSDGPAPRRLVVPFPQVHRFDPDGCAARGPDHRPVS